MTKPRAEQVALESTPFYHCTVRCVRRAFLCGEDRTSGENYDHRKQWLVSRLRFLSYVYAIDLCAYAVMSNHYHVVLHVDQSRAEGWSQEEVVERWQQLCSGHALVSRWQRQRGTMSPAELEEVELMVEQWRERLCDISWFMRHVNETIARMANAEEGCRGRFWEGRFKSQALLDDAALLTCMAYVDLNLVRAQMCDDTADSDFTSIQQRLYELAEAKARKKVRQNATEQAICQRVEAQNTLKQSLELDELPAAPLMPFDGSSHTDIHRALPFTLADYLALVDTTGRLLRPDKRGAIPETLPPLVERLGINPEQWLDHVKHFGRRYGDCSGSPEQLKAFAARKQKRWSKGIGVGRQVYRQAA